MRTRTRLQISIINVKNKMLHVFAMRRQLFTFNRDRYIYLCDVILYKYFREVLSNDFLIWQYCLLTDTL